ncbi:MAG: hypothetical protein WCA20_21165, partial [Candidatus Sulfotelmatobacter sp.]
MSPAVLEDLLERWSMPEEQGAPSPPSFREIGYGYRTGRSFGVSVLLHQLVLLLVVFSSRYAIVHSIKSVPPPLETAVPVDTEIYLPTLGGGSEGAGTRGGGSGSKTDPSSGVRARSRRGFAYPGPQPMVSDPPRATLGIQTILQPSLKNPPLLRQFLPLSNVAQPMEVATAEPPKPVLKVKTGELALRPPEDKPIQAPKITLPVAAASQVSALDASEPIVPRLLPAKPAVPDPAEINETAINRTGQKALLVVNAVPPPPDVPRNIPAAEARSLFAVTPEEATVIADPSAGSKGGALASMAAGVGTPADASSGDALAEAASGGGSKNSSGSGSGNGGRYGSAKGSGLNPAGEGAATGRGTTAGTGTGSGTGAPLGSGKGAGSAAGGGGFPGIAISGGRYGNNDAGGLHPSLTPHRQTPYGMTITSTASSGGGLPDFGVFQNEKVYTVYLDMRANDEENTPSWTLQYAVLQPQAGETSDRIRGTPTPPYATLKQVPEFTPVQVSKYARQFIVASAILNIEGQLEQVSVKQAPDSEIVDLLTEALKNWRFE